MYMALSYGISSTAKPTIERVRKSTHNPLYKNLSPNTLVGPTYLRVGNPSGGVCQKLNGDSVIHIDGFMFDQDNETSGLDVTVEISIRYKSPSGVGSFLYIMGEVDLSQYENYKLDAGDYNKLAIVVVDKSFPLTGIPDVNTGFTVNLEQKGGTKSGNEVVLQFGIY